MIEPYEAMRGYIENHIHFFETPVVAKTSRLHRDMERKKIDEYIRNRAKVTAEYFEMNSSRFNNWKPYSLKEEVGKGKPGPGMV